MADEGSHLLGQLRKTERLIGVLALKHRLWLAVTSFRGADSLKGGEPLRLSAALAGDGHLGKGGTRTAPGLAVFLIARD
jgi:hypothetical protein